MLMCDYNKNESNLWEKFKWWGRKGKKIWIKGNEMDVLKAMEWNE